MNYIEKVEILGFWGDKTVNINFKEKENFLIGVNGSGKTTIINLIAATLEADFYTLDRFQFDKLTLHLRNKDDKRKKPFIEVIKEDNTKTPYQNILFRVQQNHKDEPFELYLDDLEEEHLYRYPREEMFHRIRHRHVHSKDLESVLKPLVNISWLSIHRYKTNFRRREERSHESLVDQKLNEFSNSFLRYLSLLNRRAAEETDKFQKFIFLSLLSEEDREQLISASKSIDIEKEKESLNQIFDLFNLEQKEYKSKLDKYFKSYKKAVNNVENQEVQLKDIEYLIGIRRIHSVVQEWNELVEKQDEIYRFKDTFLSVINDLLKRKKLIIDDKNELKVETQSGKILSLSQLSSGEKQLLIILGETLLQQSNPHIYIADEPELSLHIDWQEKLVSSLKQLNPNSQIIFATHSPDIVSHYSESVIKIEEHIE